MTKFIYIGRVSLPGDHSATPLGPSIISLSGSPCASTATLLQFYLFVALKHVLQERWPTIRIRSDHNILPIMWEGAITWSTSCPLGTVATPAKVGRPQTIMWYLPGHFEKENSEPAKREREREKWKREKKTGTWGYQSKWFWLFQDEGSLLKLQVLPASLDGRKFNVTYPVWYGCLLSFIIVLKLPLQHCGLDLTPVREGKCSDQWTSHCNIHHSQYPGLTWILLLCAFSGQ